MGTEILVDRDIQSGQRLLDGLAGEGIPVRAACWIKPTDRMIPLLFIVTPLVEQKGPIQAYRDVLEVLRSIAGVSLGPSEISLLGEKHPLARDVQAIRPRYREGFLPPSFGTFGGMAVDGVYIYPPSEAFPGFNQIKQRFPSAEVFTVDLPAVLPVPQNGATQPKLGSLVGKVNADEFEGKAPETLYFAELRGSPDHDGKQLVFAYRPEGWNRLYDGKTKEWRRVVFEETKRPLYEPTDFTPLLALKAQPVASGV